mgnify:CR=1 FL=1
MNYLHEGLLELGFDKGNFFGIKTTELSLLEKKLDLYIKLLQEYNAKFDLINADLYDEIVIRHILDSLSATEQVAKIAAEHLKDEKDNFFLADIGSGAGLPGIPLATAFNEFDFTLVERMTKRCGFLNVCIEKLDLKNAHIEENQAERLEQNRFDLCVFRAFRPLEKKMMKVLRRILAPGGKLAAYKAKSEKIKEEMSLLAPNVPSYTIVPLRVPFLTENSAQEERERNLVIIEKGNL